MHVHVAPLHVDEIAMVDGVVVTSMARTVVDIARTVPFEQAVGRGRTRLWPGGLVGRPALAEALLRTTGWRGAPAARRAVAFADPGAESVGESRSRVAIMRAGLPRPVLQWEVPDRSGHLIGRTDFGWPALGAVGEFDGEVKYGRLLRPGQSPGDVVFTEKVREDRIRATELGMARWVWHELGPAFGPVAARIRAQFRAHAHRAGLTHMVRTMREHRERCASGGQARLHLRQRRVRRRLAVRELDHRDGLVAAVHAFDELRRLRRRARCRPRGRPARPGRAGA